MIVARVFFLFSLLLLAGCRHPLPVKEDPPEPEPEIFYPDNIASIFVKKCATAGCHNDISSPGAGGVNMTDWGKLMAGGNNGAVIVPFNPENSSLLYFINTDPLMGPTATPVMPYNPADPDAGLPLSMDEYLSVVEWVINGAPDKHGNIPFASYPATRQKIYITMQGCDQVGVVDAESRVVMRYIPVGKTPAIESPHCVRVDHNGRYAYVSFIGGQYIQKINTETDSIVAELFVGSGSWNIVNITPDNNELLITDWSSNGKAVRISTSDAGMQVIETITGLRMPHGVECLPGGVFLVTSEAKNIVYKITAGAPPYKEISVGNWDSHPTDPNTAMVLHEILLTPDRSRYFLTCQNSGEVRVMDTYADTLIRVIPVGFYPQELAISKTEPYIFVTCMEDASNQPGFKGSVYAINYETYETHRIDGPFYQPHGITVDDLNGVVYVVSSNADPNGPAPHHASSCNGRNGYYNVYDLKTLARLPKRYEVTVMPYSAATRFR